MKKGTRTPDELRRFTDPGPGAPEVGEHTEDAAGGDGADAPPAEGSGEDIEG